MSTININVSKADMGLDQVDNTSDLNKPISTATQTALNNKVDKVTGSRLITSAEATILGNTSGTNTGDQNLQSVTDEGSTTSNNISIEDTVFRTFLAPNSVQISPKTLATYSVLDADGKLQLKTNATSYGVLKATNVTAETTLEFPNKTAGSYTIATTSDLSGYQATLTATNLKTLVDTFTVTTTPIDADVVPITDSVGTTTKKLSWSNFKTTLLAYFDTIFPRITVASTGSVISFNVPVVWNTPASPSASNLTDDLTNAKIGYIQKIYHNKSVAPTVPAGWVLMGTGTYTTSTLNVIFAEYVSGSRIEYWITKPA